MQWTQALVGTSLEGKLAAIDGKTLRGSCTGANKKHPLHWVTAWVADNQVVFGQGATEARSNEVTAIPKLLEMWALHGATVAIDAMGCQRAIAEQIVQGRHGVLALEGNRASMAEQVESAFVTADIAGEALDVAQRDKQTETAHGRVETRSIVALDVANCLSEKQDWEGLCSVVRAESTRQVGDEITAETRCTISSHKPDAAVLGQ